MTAGMRYVLRTARGARLGEIAPGQTELYLDLDASGTPVLAATNNGSRHARILIRIGRFSLEDLGGKTGTWLGEERLVARSIHTLNLDVPFRLGASGTPLVLTKEEGARPAQSPVLSQEPPAVKPVPPVLSHKPQRVHAAPRAALHRNVPRHAAAPPPLPANAVRPQAKVVAGAFERYEKAVAPENQPYSGDATEIPTIEPPKLLAAINDAAAPGTVPNYLAQSILVTFLCCMPVGLVALSFSLRVNTRLAAGDREGALEASRNASRWILVGTSLAMLFWIFFMVTR